MFRSILVPSIIVCVLAIPFIISESKSGKSKGLANPSGQTGQQVGYQDYGGNNPMVLPSSQFSSNQISGSGQNQSVNFQTAPIGNPVFTNNAYRNPAATGSQNLSIPNHSFTQNGQGTFGPGVSLGGVPALQASAPLIIGDGSFGGTSPNFAGMTPDFGAAQTFVLPGNAHGPDLNAQPLEFVPVTNFEEVIRFDISQNWVKQRWKRVSTAPGDRGLHGLRVALVTGTNSWDLHGSLTYFFDGSQRVQRITFRGWAGDGTRLINLLTQKFGFRPHQTHWAGFYIAQPRQKPTGGLLMQHPTVIYTENPVQQLAIVLEINNPNSPFSLSEDFHSLIEGSRNSQ